MGQASPGPGNDGKGKLQSKRVARGIGAAMAPVGKDFIVGEFTYLETSQMREQLGLV